MPQNFEYHHSANAANDKFGGSPYIQAKVTNARDTLLKEIEEANKSAEDAEGGDTKKEAEKK